MPLLAKKYNARMIALTMGSSGIPVAADERVNIAVETLIPRMMEIDYPDGKPDHRPAGADCFWLPAVLPAIDRGGADAAVCLGSVACDFGRAFECFKCSAGAEPPVDQPGLLAMLMGVGLQMMIAQSDGRAAEGDASGSSRIAMTATRWGGCT